MIDLFGGKLNTLLAFWLQNGKGDEKLLVGRLSRLML